MDRPMPQRTLVTSRRGALDPNKRISEMRALTPLTWWGNPIRRWGVFAHWRDHSLNSGFASVGRGARSVVRFDLRGDETIRPCAVTHENDLFGPELGKAAAPECLHVHKNIRLLRTG